MGMFFVICLSAMVLAPSTADGQVANLRHAKKDEVLNSETVAAARPGLEDAKPWERELHYEGKHCYKRDCKKGDEMKKTIVEIAAANDNFSTLVSLVQLAGLADTLSGSGPFTVFAPTNKAFEKLPEELVESLLEEENRDELKNILLYHVLNGKFYLHDLIKKKDVETLLGEDVEIRRGYYRPKVNKSRITKADIKAKNGVIHVIGKVLIPPDSE